MKIQSDKIELVSVKSLINHPKNNNKHSKEQIERLTKLIEYQGFRNPLVVQKGTNLIVAGHGRLQAAKKLGMKEVPVTYQEFDSEAQLYAYLTSDNAIHSWSEIDLSMVNAEMLDFGPDFDIDMLGIKDFVIEPIEKFEPQSDEDDVPEVVHPITRKGDLWLLGKHRLLCGDSTMIDDVERLMDGQKADMVFTDPPYGGKVVGRAQGKDTGFNKAINKIKNATEFISHFDPKDFLQTLSYIDPPSSYVFTNLTILKDYLSENSKLLVWHKKHGLPSVGNYNSDIEFIVFTKRPGAFFNNGDNRLSYSRLISMVKKDRDLHPTMKPVELIENCLEVSSIKGGVVADFFLGSGSTLIACEKIGRKCFGMELDEHYCDVIIKRWEQYTGKKATLESTGQTYEELKAERDGQS